MPIPSDARQQLIRLKTRTGIPHWNVLCRWAFCLSLWQASPPAPLEIPADSNVEMTGHGRDEGRGMKVAVGMRDKGMRTGLRCTLPWLASFDCICTVASATWLRRRRFARSAI